MPPSNHDLGQDLLLVTRALREAVQSDLDQLDGLLNRRQELIAQLGQVSLSPEICDAILREDRAYQLELADASAEISRQLVASHGTKRAIRGYQKN